MQEVDYSRCSRNTVHLLTLWLHGGASVEYTCVPLKRTTLPRFRHMLAGRRMPAPAMASRPLGRWVKWRLQHARQPWQQEDSHGCLCISPCPAGILPAAHMTYSQVHCCRPDSRTDWLAVPTQLGQRRRHEWPAMHTDCTQRRLSAAVPSTVGVSVRMCLANKHVKCESMQHTCTRRVHTNTQQNPRWHKHAVYARKIPPVHGAHHSCCGPWCPSLTSSRLCPK